MPTLFALSGSLDPSREQLEIALARPATSRLLCHSTASARIVEVPFSRVDYGPDLIDSVIEDRALSAQFLQQLYQFLDRCCWFSAFE